MKKDELIEKMKRTVHDTEPEAEIILYGSRSREDSRTESDWDILVLFDGPITDARILAKARRWHVCVNRLYYACFYAVSALLILHSLSSSKHSGVRSLFNKNFREIDG